jgi:hypothetical protein
MARALCCGGAESLPSLSNSVMKPPALVVSLRFSHKSGHTCYWVVAVDVLGQEGPPSSPV